MTRTNIRIQLSIGLFIIAVTLSCHKNTNNENITSSQVTPEQSIEANSAQSQPQPIHASVDTDSLLTSIPRDFIGTYLPIVYIQELRSRKSHIAALRATIDAGTYSVLSISAEYIYSNRVYYDQYALDPIEFNHNWSNQDSSTITDAKGNVYQKISSDSAYDTDLRIFFFQEFSCSKEYEDSNGNKLSIYPDGSLRVNTDKYDLDLIGLRGENDVMDLILSHELHQFFGLEIKDCIIRLYEVHFKQDTAPILDIEEGSVAEAYIFNPIK